VAYVNMVGGQDELVFDGDSMIVAADGTLIARSPQFDEDLMIADLDLPAASPSAAPVSGGTDQMRIDRIHLSDSVAAPSQPAPPPVITPRVTDEAEIWVALTLGLRDYVRKNGFKSVVVAVSGGIDSAVVAALACDAVGAEHVVGVSMPS